jgi:ADP-ribose diphosphatase
VEYVANMPKLPEIIKIQEVTRTRLFKIESVDLVFSNGVKTQFERICGNPRGAVMVIPMKDDETVLLIREYSVGTERYELQLPKGKIDGDEGVLETANRELMEEIGYASNNLTFFRSLNLAPGYMRHETHVVIARDLYPGKMEGDEPEALEVVEWKIDNLNALFEREDCSEARTIAALLLLKEKLSDL